MPKDSKDQKELDRDFYWKRVISLATLFDREKGFVGSGIVHELAKLILKVDSLRA